MENFTKDFAISYCERYAKQIMRNHDLDINRNNQNRQIFETIMKKCKDDLDDTLLSYIENEAKLQYFVRQTILYLVAG